MTHLLSVAGVWRVLAPIAHLLLELEGISIYDSPAVGGRSVEGVNTHTVAHLLLEVEGISIYDSPAVGGRSVEGGSTCSGMGGGTAPMLVIMASMPIPGWGPAEDPGSGLVSSPLHFANYVNIKNNKINFPQKQLKKNFSCSGI